MPALADAGSAPSRWTCGGGRQRPYAPRLRPGQPRARHHRGHPLAGRAGRRARRTRPGRLSGVDGRGDAAQAGAPARGVLDAASAALALGDARRTSADARPVRTSGASSGRGCRSVSSSRTRGAGGPADPGLVRARAGRTTRPSPSTGGRCAMPSTAHCSIEPYRWMVRSMARPDGIQFNRRMKRPVRVPTLHLHGSLDPVMRTRSAAGSGRVRRGAVPLAAVRRARALPARGGPGGLLDRTDQLAEGPRAGPLTADGGHRLRTVRRRTANCPRA